MVNDPRAPAALRLCVRCKTASADVAVHGSETEDPLLYCDPCWSKAEHGVRLVAGSAIKAVLRLTRPRG